MCDYLSSFLCVFPSFTRYSLGTRRPMKQRKTFSFLLWLDGSLGSTQSTGTTRLQSAWSSTAVSLMVRWCCLCGCMQVIPQVNENLDFTSIHSLLKLLLLLYHGLGLYLILIGCSFICDIWTTIESSKTFCSLF